MTNEEIVNEIQEGKNVRENLEKLYIQNGGLITAICNKYSFLAEFDDLKQECYFALVKAVEHYHGGNTKFSTYLTVTMMRHCKYYGDRNTSAVSGTTEKPVSLDNPIAEDARIRTDYVDVIPDTEELPEDAAQRHELRAALDAAIDSLPEEQGNAIRQRYYNGRTYAEIAKDGDVAPHIARQRCLSALETMRRGRTGRKLRQFLPDDVLYSMGIRHGSQWESSTERAALKDYEKATAQISRKNGFRIGFDAVMAKLYAEGTKTPK